MSLFHALGTGLTGLKAASAGLSATNQNVANASVRGFTRRTADVSTADPVRRGLVWLGSGARLDGMSRAADPFALGRMFASTAQSGAAGAEHAALVQLEPLFEPAVGTSLRAAVDGIFDALAASTSDPSDLGLRRNVLGALGTFASTANGLGRGLEAGIADREAAVRANVDSINADLAEVAELNRMMLGAGSGAADLADRRDAAIGRLAERIGASVYFERDGSATVRIGGHAAVSGPAARTVAVLEDPLGEPGLSITLSVDEGAVVVQPDGGTIGGELAARAELLGWLGQLDVLAADLATALDGAHAAGFTPGGAPGGPLFVLPGSGSAASGLRVDSALLADPGSLAFASSPAGLPGDGGNLGALLGLQDAAVVGGRTAAQSASSLVAQVASDTSLAGLRAEAAEATALDAVELYANLSAVDLDEEAVSLLQYQAAYQAAAKVIQATDETLSALMSLV
jgi:flagellar hook-associated protein 1